MKFLWFSNRVRIRVTDALNVATMGRLMENSLQPPANCSAILSCQIHSQVFLVRQTDRSEEINLISLL